MAFGVLGLFKGVAGAFGDFITSNGDSFGGLGLFLGVAGAVSAAPFFLGVAGAVSAAPFLLGVVGSEDFLAFFLGGSSAVSVEALVRFPVTGEGLLSHNKYGSEGKRRGVSVQLTCETEDSHSWQRGFESSAKAPLSSLLRRQLPR